MCLFSRAGGEGAPRCKSIGMEKSWTTLGEVFAKSWRNLGRFRQISSLQQGSGGVGEVRPRLRTKDKAKAKAKATKDEAKV